MVFLLSNEVSGFFSFLNPIINFLQDLGHYGLALYTFFEVLLIIPPIEVIYYPLILLDVDNWYLYLINVVFFNVIASAFGYFVGKKIGYPMLRYFSSEEMLDKIVVNAVLPLYFLRAEIYSDFSLMEKGFRLLEKIKAEENSVVKQWKEAQLTPHSAYESQALTELYKEYCSQKKCLNCSIGYSILKNKSTYVREN